MPRRRKSFVKQLAPSVALHRDPKNGSAWVEDGRSGTGHSCHPNISASGSVAGMKRRGIWHRSDRTARSHGFIYNISQLSYSDDDFDEVARLACRCDGFHGGSDDPRGVLERYGPGYMQGRGAA